MRQRSREQVIGAILAVLVTTIIIIEFVVDSRAPAPRPQVIQVELYSPNRTDAEIIADQKKDQAERRAAEAKKRREFKNLGKQLGIE
ncbi:MAG TPA: hypothetical protein VFI88_05765 [Sphingomicrobium sp.]|nr:hypothetical protein [Sphingomicrobium sp.]